MLERIKNIILSPSLEWQKIKNEEISALSIFLTYAVPLALITPLFGVLGLIFEGVNVSTTLAPAAHKISFIQAAIWILVHYAYVLFSIYIEVIVVNILAPYFGARPDFKSALMVVVYSSIPGLIAGVICIIPSFAFLSLIAVFYGIYLLYTGFNILMESPKNRTAVFLIVTIIVIVLLNIPASIIGNYFFSLWMRG